MAKSDDKITLENFTSPGHTYRVDRRKYEAMRSALLAVLPAEAPGLTVAEAQKRRFCRSCPRSCFLAERSRAGG
jgi:hypothetical protein